MELDDSSNSSSIGSDDVQRSKTELMLVFFSESYSELKSISVSISRTFSSPALYYLLTTCQAQFILGVKVCKMDSELCRLVK